MRQLDFAAPAHPTEMRREIKRMFHLRLDEISRGQMTILLEQAMQEVVTEQVQADPCERAREGLTDVTRAFHVVSTPSVV